MRLIEADRERYSEDGKPPVAWERYLEVAPGIAALDPEVRPDALAERELDAEVWTRAESYWVLTFALDLQQGRTDRVDAFGRACAEVLATQTPAQPATRPALEANIEAPPPSEKETPPAPVPPVELPSFLKVAELPPPSVALAAPVVPAAPVAPPLVALRPRDFAGTVELAPAQVEPALPFGHAHSPEYVARLTAPRHAPAPARADRPDATVMDAGPRTTAVLPFHGAGAGAVPRSVRQPEITLEQHARLSAELSMSRDDPSRAAALASYGVDGVASLTALGALWKERLEADQTAAARWKAAYAKHRKGLSKKPR